MKNSLTLVEIITAVILILLLITVSIPWFTRKQVLFKVAQVKADIKIIAQAMEAYFTDHGTFPPMESHIYGSGSRYINNGSLTTPVVYIDKVPVDVFRQTAKQKNPSFLISPNELQTNSPHGFIPYVMWMTWGIGPDLTGSIPGGRTYKWIEEQEALGKPAARYDPTNGLRSNGDIIYWGGTLSDNMLGSSGESNYWELPEVSGK